jgi:triphosphatase
MDAVARQPEALQLAPDFTVGDGLQEMLAGALGALHRHGAGAKIPSPESVHRFRVGVRRLRSILSAFSEALPEQERRALSDRLRAIAQRYGRVREWDVFLAHTVAALRRAMPEEDQALAELEQGVGEARQRALPPGDTLKSSVGAVQAAIDEAPWLRQPPAAAMESWQLPLRDYARGLLDQRHRRLRKRVKSVDLADRAAFHKLRIRVKKLRYPAELLKSLFDEEGAVDYLKRLVSMQEVLGTLNDALTGRVLVAELPVPAATQRLVLGWSAHELETCRDRFPGYARAFRRAEPFWAA